MHYLCFPPLAGLRMAGVTELIDLCVEEIFVFGGVRFVAGHTPPVTFNRGVGRRGFLAFIRMAGKTKGLTFIHQQMAVFGIMGIMTVQTHSPLKGGMDDFSFPLQRLLVVTGGTECRPFLGDAEGFRGVRGIMAGIA